MSHYYHIRLSNRDLGQLLDGLEIRAESWENTASYLRNSGYQSEDFFLVEECSKPEEADNIATHYRAIVALIQKQMVDQS